jgi:hypothetical protein
VRCTAGISLIKSHIAGEGDCALDLEPVVLLALFEKAPDNDGDAYAGHKRKGIAGAPAHSRRFEKSVHVNIQKNRIGAASAA